MNMGKWKKENWEIEMGTNESNMKVEQIKKKRKINGRVNKGKKHQTRKWRKSAARPKPT